LRHPRNENPLEPGKKGKSFTLVEGKKESSPLAFWTDNGNGPKLVECSPHLHCPLEKRKEKRTLPRVASCGEGGDAEKNGKKPPGRFTLSPLGGGGGCRVHAEGKKKKSHRPDKKRRKHSSSPKDIPNYPKRKKQPTNEIT